MQGTGGEDASAEATEPNIGRIIGQGDAMSDLEAEYAASNEAVLRARVKALEAAIQVAINLLKQVGFLDDADRLAALLAAKPNTPTGGER